MGVDIYGWVEVKEPRANNPNFSLKWRALMDISLVVERSYAIFGSLFGVRNEDGFSPIAAGRGFPHDASDRVLRDSADGAVKPTWLGPEDLAHVDWDEVGAREVERGGEVFEYQMMDSSGQTSSIQSHEHGEVEHEVRKRWSRDEVMTPGWRATLAIMQALALRFGAQGVRLVVWFDSN